MIKLTRVKDPRTLDLSFGVSVVVKPLSLAVWRRESRGGTPGDSGGESR